MGLEAIGSLLLRVAMGFLFLACAHGCSSDEAARRHAVADAGLVFKWRPDLFAALSVVMAGAAGLSVLLGIFPRFGALAMVVYLVPAAMIHFALRREAVALKDKLLAELGDNAGSAVRNDVNQLGEAAAFAHFTAALKNLFLIGPAAYLVLAGARPPLLIGFGPGWQLQGMLVP